MNRRELIALFGATALTRAEQSHASVGAALVAAPSIGRPQGSPLLTALCDRILPATDTPGAVAARVPEFIDHFAATWYTDTERERFTGWLAAIDAHSVATRGRPFTELAPDDQAALLTDLDARDGAEGTPERAMSSLKSLVVFGYFTSELVMRDVTRYNPMPGRFDGCAPITG